MTWVQTAAQIGGVIAAARRHRGLTQVQLARETGVTQAWISQIEQGKDNAQLGKVLRILSYLGVRLRVGEAPWDERASPPRPELANIPRILADLAGNPANRGRKGRK
jgi:HTH-type transcriptional regulator / antitoxin HipB